MRRKLGCKKKEKKLSQNVEKLYFNYFQKNLPDIKNLLIQLFAN